MSSKQKKNLIRIIAALILMIGLQFIPIDNEIVRFILYMIPYFIVGYDILYKAFLSIKNREAFDENFLMAIATIGAVCLGEYEEGVEVMLFYQIGEWFQSYAVGKSRKNIAALMDIRPEYANLETENGIEQVDPEEVEVDGVELAGVLGDGVFDHVHHVAVGQQPGQLDLLIGGVAGQGVAGVGHGLDGGGDGVAGDGQHVEDGPADDIVHRHHHDTGDVQQVEHQFRPSFT